jgi:hypothetical protein
MVLGIATAITTVMEMAMVMVMVTVTVLDKEAALAKVKAMEKVMEKGSSVWALAPMPIPIWNRIIKVIIVMITAATIAETIVEMVTTITAITMAMVMAIMVRQLHIMRHHHVHTTHKALEGLKDTRQRLSQVTVQDTSLILRHPLHPRNVRLKRLNNPHKRNKR